MRDGDPASWSIAERLARLSPDDVTAIRAELGEAGWARLQSLWALRGRPAQLAPPGNWRVWLIQAGRGFGKTRAGAEWVDALARAQGGLHIALVGATMKDVRAVMIEGESGLLNAAHGRRRALWKPSLGRLIWPSGTIGRCY